MKIYKIIALAVAAFFIAACTSAGRTPTETIKALSEAGKKKDAAAMRKMLSKGSLEMIEKSSKAQNQTTDRIMTGENGVQFQNVTEYGAEKIEGDKATVELKNELMNEFEAIPLVREDGEWKVALDKYAEDFIKNLNEQMKPANSNVAPNVNIAPSNSNQTNIKPNTNQNSAAKTEELKSIQNRLKNN